MPASGTHDFLAPLNDGNQRHPAHRLDIRDHGLACRADTISKGFCEDDRASSEQDRPARYDFMTRKIEVIP